MQNYEYEETIADNRLKKNFQKSVDQCTLVQYTIDKINFGGTNMAIPDNKERIAITLTKESMEALKKAAKDNFRRPSDEVEALIVKYIINNSK